MLDLSLPFDFVVFDLKRCVMNSSIRMMLSPLVKTSQQQATRLTASSLLVLRPCQCTASRGVGYLHRGSRVRGLVRDESDYLVSPKGIPYGASEESLSPLKRLLGDQYALPDEVSLQVLTHKSFAHGKKPFNEKLAVLGSHFLKYKSSIYTINTDGLSHIGTQGAKQIISERVLARFVENAGVGESIYWKKRDPLQTDAKKSGQHAVYARTAEAIVGAILLNHGKDTASRFVYDVLLNGEDGLVKAASQIRSSQPQPQTTA